MLSNIDIVIKSDYEIPYQDQDYHDNRVELFKFQFSQWLDKSKIQYTGVMFINCIYNPQTRLFEIVKFEPNDNRILNNLKNDINFYNKYF